MDHRTINASGAWLTSGKYTRWITSTPKVLLIFSGSAFILSGTGSSVAIFRPLASSVAAASGYARTSTRGGRPRSLPDFRDSPRE
ncbi:Uncharacterised protein [Mycobacteroides abscessus subsp. bolletii]|nr:Uncharacterised protein [Mycobacteroides abscessus subsp. bolletii]SHY66267.1 Uncharacterised protein [Mycobacteroides abscessus subsp. bolletii]